MSWKASLAAAKTASKVPYEEEAARPLSVGASRLVAIEASSTNGNEEDQWVDDDETLDTHHQPTHTISKATHLSTDNTSSKAVKKSTSVKALKHADTDVSQPASSTRPLDIGTGKSKSGKATKDASKDTATSSSGAGVSKSGKSGKVATQDATRPGSRSTLAPAHLQAVAAGSSSSRNGDSQPAFQLGKDGVRVLKNQRKGLAVFQADSFGVSKFIASAYQGLPEKGIEGARQDLTILREHCHQQVQKVVHQNYQHFLESCKGRAVLDEAVAELRGCMQGTTALLATLTHDRNARREQAEGGHGAVNGVGVLPGLSGGDASRPLADGIQAQVRTLLAELAVAVAERDYGTAVSLLGVGQEVLAVISRDAHILAVEVGDVASWQQPWEASLAEFKKGLIAELQAFLVRGGPQLSAPEVRAACAVLAALAGDAFAAGALFACYTARRAAVQQQLLRHYTSVGTGGEEAARDFALALCQRSFIGIGAAADDVAAVFGRATVPTAALLTCWAAQEARGVAQSMRYHALTPFADTTDLGPTMLCVQVGLVVCETLEISHALSLTAPFMAELWFHLEGMLQRSLHHLLDDARTQSMGEMARLLQQHTAGADLGLFRPGATNNLVPLASAAQVVTRFQQLARSVVPLAGPKLGAVLRPRLLGVLAALMDGVVMALHKGAAAKQGRAVAEVGQGVMSFLQVLLQDEGVVTQALASLVPGCGPLLQLSELRAAVSSAAVALSASLPHAPPQHPPDTPLPSFPEDPNATAQRNRVPEMQHSNRIQRAQLQEQGPQQAGSSTYTDISSSWKANRRTGTPTGTGPEGLEPVGDHALSDKRTPGHAAGIVNPRNTNPNQPPRALPPLPGPLLPLPRLPPPADDGNGVTSGWSRLGSAQGEEQAHLDIVHTLGRSRNQGAGQTNSQQADIGNDMSAVAILRQRRQAAAATAASQQRAGSKEDLPSTTTLRQRRQVAAAAAVGSQQPGSSGEDMPSTSTLRQRRQAAAAAAAASSQYQAGSEEDMPSTTKLRLHRQAAVISSSLQAPEKEHTAQPKRPADSSEDEDIARRLPLNSLVPKRPHPSQTQPPPTGLKPTDKVWEPGAAQAPSRMPASHLTQPATSTRLARPISSTAPQSTQLATTTSPPRHKSTGSRPAAIPAPEVAMGSSDEEGEGGAAARVRARRAQRNPSSTPVGPTVIPARLQPVSSPTQPFVRPGYQPAADEGRPREVLAREAPPPRGGKGSVRAAIPVDATGGDSSEEDDAAARLRARRAARAAPPAPPIPYTVPPDPISGASTSGMTRAATPTSPVLAAIAAKPGASRAALAKLRAQAADSDEDSLR